MEIEKHYFSAMIATIAQKKKALSGNITLEINTTTEEIELLREVLLEIKCHNLKNVHFEKNHSHKKRKDSLQTRAESDVFSL